MQSESRPSSHMPPRTTTDRFEDEETSSLSDYDSEWTQVSGTEDDSDYPPLTAASDRPSSRAGTIDGSVDGDVWEGFVDGIHQLSSQSSEETRPLNVDATDEAPAYTQSLSASVASRTSEDEIVNNALDSSFVGTLRASRVRSAMSSMHASLTESQSKLRLSFPDPLRSREDSDSEPASQDASLPTSAVEDNCENITAEDASSSFASIEAPSTHCPSGMADECDEITIPIRASASCILSIFLYGSAASLRWQTAERIISLVLQIDCKASSLIDEGHSRRYHFYCPSLDGTVLKGKEPFFVRLVDRTSKISEMVFDDVDDDAPSIAILLLPSRLPSFLPRHSFYIPLISPSSIDFGSASPLVSSAFSEQVTVDSAHYTWEKLDLPKEDIIVLDREHPDAILDASALENTHRQAALVEAFSVIFKKSTKGLDLPENHEESIFANKWQMFAFVAVTILAVTVGAVRMHRNLVTVRTTVNGTVEVAAVNASLSVESSSALAALAVASTHYYSTGYSAPRSLATVVAKTAARRAFAFFDSESDFSSLTKADRGTVSPTAKSVVTSTSSANPNTCRSKARSWADKLNLSLNEYIPKDMIVRPAGVMGTGGRKSMTSGSRHATAGTSGVRLSGNDVKSLSLRAAQNSLALVSSRGKALMKVAGKDMMVFSDAIDDLLQALGRQVNVAKSEMKEAKSWTHSSFSVRNARARDNARRLRLAGEHFIKAAGERLKTKGGEGINVVRQVCDNAKAIGQEAIDSRQSRRLRRRKTAASGERLPR